MRWRVLMNSLAACVVVAFGLKQQKRKEKKQTERGVGLPNKDWYYETVSTPFLSDKVRMLELFFILGEEKIAKYLSLDSYLRFPKST